MVSSCVPSAYNTLPEQLPEGNLRESVLYIPAGLQIVSVDYDAELIMASFDGTSVSEGTRGRAFIHVYAEDKQSREQYLLIYENLGQNLRPIQVIRFQED